MNADGSNNELTDIGSGVKIEIRRMPEGHPDAGKVGGIYYEHPCVNGTTKPGFAPVKDEKGWPSTGWDLVSEDPLTIAPSLLCPLCGHHGFLRDGRWQPA